MTYRSFKHFKRPVFRTDISNHNWDFLSSSKDPNELWSEWKSNFLAIADKNAPIRTKRVRSQKSPWITADLKKLMHSRDIMKIKAINSNDPHDWACFKKMGNKVNFAIQAKQLFYKNKFSKSDGDPRKTWQVINELTSRKTGRSSVRELSLNGVSITNSTALSNAFNDHFSTIGSKLASEIPFNNGSSFQEYISGLSERFQLVSTDSNQVLSLFNKTLNKSKGAGLDGISSRLILDCADLIAPHISIIFNSSLANGIFRDDWKSARVTPPFKHGKAAI